MKSPRYTKFVADKNAALEVLHLKAQHNISSFLNDALANVKMVCGHNFEQIKAHGLYSPQGKHYLKHLDQQLLPIMQLLGHQALEETKSLRRKSYALSYAGEAEAIGQAINKPTHYSLTADKLHAVMQSDSFSGGPIDDRIQLALNKLQRRIMTTVELSAIRDETQQEMQDNLLRVFPKKSRLPSRSIKKDVKVQESFKDDQKNMPDMSQGYLDETTWGQITSDYQKDYVPDWRGPDSVVDTVAGEAGPQDVYAWEVEKEVTQDFVYQVRSGQVDAAKENGINDYVWVAIVDKVTDDCCLWRDGLTTTEIEEMLNTERSDDDCQAIVPPAHVKCRCVLAPMVDEMPDQPASNEKDFDTWLSE